MSSTHPARARKQPEGQRPTVLVDRSIGRLAVPEALRLLGFVVYTLWDIYGPAAEQTVSDAQWVKDSAQREWIALTWDFLREKETRDVIVAEQAKVFRFERKMNTAATQIVAFTFNQYRVVQRSRKTGGWIDVIRPKKVERYWP